LRQQIWPKIVFLWRVVPLVVPSTKTGRWFGPCGYYYHDDCSKSLCDSCFPLHPTSMENIDTVPATPARSLPKIKFRVLIIGRANAGKTSILQRVCDTTDSPIIYRNSDRQGDREQVRGLILSTLPIWSDFPGPPDSA
jgi:hypothetical protein